MENSLITIGASEVMDAVKVQGIDALNQHFNDSLAKYNIPFEVKWKPGMTFSKLVREAQDASGRTYGNDETSAKKARSSEFKRINAIFVLEGLHDMIEAACRVLGFQARFTGSTSTGAVNMKLVPQVSTKTQKEEALWTLVNSMADQKQLADAKSVIKQLKQKAVEAGVKVVDIEAIVSSLE